MRQEFEARTTPEARFARALDALQPMLLTWGAGGPGLRGPAPGTDTVSNCARTCLGAILRGAHGKNTVLRRWTGIRRLSGCSGIRLKPYQAH
ncbi:HD domain-containing protein [Deinococcus taklimakanensis]|uniref:HD domain-containing protein n=1 Tax=Deinococcus taklimakanensis TaxID=536443 RepID=A0ABW5P846_9DEIO